MSFSDEAFEKLANRLSKKEIITVEISGTCDDRGFLIQYLNLPVKLNPNVSHKISLVSLECTSFFPNVIANNNKFYYSVGGSSTVKEIIIPEGAYEFEQYNEVVKRAIETNGDDKDSINIAVNYSTARTEVILKNGYKVYFDRDNTWRDVLGFENKVLNTDGLHISDKIANNMLVQKVYVICDICQGSLTNTMGNINMGNILFSFPNNKRFGYPISILPSVLRPRNLRMNEFDTIRLQFKSDLNQPVNFMKSMVTGELLIEQH